MSNSPSIGKLGRCNIYGDVSQLVRDEVSTVSLVEFIVGVTDSDAIDSKDESGEPGSPGLGRIRRRTIVRNGEGIRVLMKVY